MLQGEKKKNRMTTTLDVYTHTRVCWVYTMFNKHNDNVKTVENERMQSRDDEEEKKKTTRRIFAWL